jgi:hypothetical protein
MMFVSMKKYKAALETISNLEEDKSILTKEIISLNHEHFVKRLEDYPIQEEASLRREIESLKKLLDEVTIKYNTAMDVIKIVHTKPQQSEE